MPNWLVLDNATYVGRANISTITYSGIADSWEANGVQSNYWYQTVDAKPVELAQVPDDYQYFDPYTYVVAPQPDSLFTVPAYAGAQCPFSICSLVIEGDGQQPLN
jgi:hypothetical protein